MTHIKIITVKKQIYIYINLITKITKITKLLKFQKQQIKQQKVTETVTETVTESKIFLCSSKSFLIFRGTTTRFLIDWCLIKKGVVRNRSHY